MRNINIKETKGTPAISTTFDKGLVEISGVSIPENTDSFYKDIRKWVDDYLYNNSVINFTLKFHYLNSSSVNVIANLLKDASILGEVNVEWYYESDDEDMFDVGDAISQACGMEFKFEERDEIF